MDPGPSLLQRLGHVIEAWAAARPTGPCEGEIGLSRVSAVNPTERLHDLPKNSFKVQDTTRPCKHIRVIVLTHMKDGAPCEDPEIRISNSDRAVFTPRNHDVFQGECRVFSAA